MIAREKLARYNVKDLKSEKQSNEEKIFENVVPRVILNRKVQNWFKKGAENEHDNKSKSSRRG